MSENIKVFLIEQFLLIITIFVTFSVFFYIVPVVVHYSGMLFDKLFITDASINPIISTEDIRSFIGSVYKIATCCILFVFFIVEEFYSIFALFDKNYGYEEGIKRREKFRKFLRRYAKC